MVRGLLGVGDDGKDQQEKGRGWDTFFEIARKEEEFKEDPITDEQRQNERVERDCERRHLHKQKARKKHANSHTSKHTGARRLSRERMK